jgi:hypothetical protein
MHFRSDAPRAIAQSSNTFKANEVTFTDVEDDTSVIKLRDGALQVWVDGRCMIDELDSLELSGSSGHEAVHLPELGRARLRDPPPGPRRQAMLRSLCGLAMQVEGVQLEGFDTPMLLTGDWSARDGPPTVPKPEAYFVRGAGVDFVNGTYVRDGEYKGADRYVQQSGGQIWLIRYTLPSGSVYWYLADSTFIATQTLRAIRC